MDRLKEQVSIMAGDRGFGSDNHAGVHPEVLDAIAAANKGHAHSYGDDRYTREATAIFRRHFGEEVEPFFVFNGTGANVTSLAALTRSFEAVICADTSHLHIDECGAPEQVGGVKLLTLPTPDGKLTPDIVQPKLAGRGDEHQVRPRVLSIAQTTELGTVYTPDEIGALAECAHKAGLYLHVDGARFANAAAALGVEFRAISTDVGVDVLSFGGTKNGLMLGEAVVFFDGELARDYRFARKQGMQLASKMRFVAAQFSALLGGELWRQSAEHANRMARLLEQKVREIEGVEVTQQAEANAVFARLPQAAIPILQEQFFFYVWDAASGEVRWMTAFDTTEEDVEAFVACIQETMAGLKK
jgi:threonine aldolase